MPPPKKAEANKKATLAQKVEPVKTAKTELPEPKDEDRIDFVNVKDLIKGMEKQKTNEPSKAIEQKETNGFHKKITDNGHDNGHDSDEKTEKVDQDVEQTEDEEKTDEKTEKTIKKTIEKSDSTESSDATLSRSNSYINGVPVQVPKPLPRSSISETGSMDEGEAPKPKPRTTTVPGSGYKVLCYLVKRGFFYYRFL